MTPDREAEIRAAVEGQLRYEPMSRDRFPAADMAELLAELDALRAKVGELKSDTFAQHQCVMMARNVTAKTTGAWCGLDGEGEGLRFVLTRGRELGLFEEPKG